MIETIKAWLIKVLAPLAFVAGFIYFLFKGKPTDDGEKKFIADNATTKEKQDEVDAKAGNALDDYESAKRKLLGGDEP